MRRKVEATARHKIALFIPDLHMGGAERVFLTLSKQLSARGYEVEIVLANKKGELLAEVDPSVKIVDLQAFRPGESAWKNGLRVMLRLRHYMVECSPDVLLSTLTGANLVAIAARILVGRKTRLVIREAASLANVKSRMRRILMRRLYPFVDQVVVLTDFMSHELQESLGLSGGKISVIGNPIDVDRIDALVGERVESQKTTAWKPYLLSIGRLAEQKDFSTMIKAFALLCRDMDLNLVILGDGPQRQVLEELVADLGLSARVHMPGRVMNPYPWLAQASVFVLSSRWEGYPNVLLEAQYLKRPIVTTEYDRSVRQILAFSRKEQFRVIPVAHPVMMADSIRELLVQKSAVYDDVTLNDMTGSALDDYEAVLTAGTA